MQAQEKVLEMLYQEHQATVAKCAKLENSLRTMKSAVQQALSPQGRRRHARYDSDDRDDMGRARGSSRRHDKPPSRSIRHDDNAEFAAAATAAAAAAAAAADTVQQSTEPEAREDERRVGEEDDEDEAAADDRSPFIPEPKQRLGRLEGIAMVEVRSVRRYADDEDDSEEEAEEDETSALETVPQPSPGADDQQLKPEADGDEAEGGEDTNECLSADSSQRSDQSSSHEEDSLEELDDDVDGDNGDPGNDDVLSGRSSEEGSDDSVELLRNPDLQDELDGTPSSSLERPDDSIAQMQRFYSSLPIDDILH